MLNRDKNRGFIVVSTILLLLNLSFSLFSARLVNQQNSDNSVGMSGPIVSFGQTAEVVLVAALKRTTSFSSLKLVKNKIRNSFIYIFAALGFTYVASSRLAIFKTTQNLKLEGG